ncbi:MAG: DUF4381 domain-containing protein [Alphaproteobacteria bacterium]|nr:DUF4381 domain-containing protein [Alphaproteobacteria bacterium]
MPDNLPDLRDIHLANGVSFWPLGYGWWVILAAIIIGFVAARLALWLRRKSKKLYALRLIRGISANDVIPSAALISEILKRICVYKYPDAVALSGKKWLAFLNSHTSASLSDKTGSLLLNAPYMSPDTADFSPHDLELLQKFGIVWIGENL